MFSDSIKALAADAPDWVREEADTIVSAMLLLMDETCLNEETEEDKYSEWVAKCAAAWCAISGEHAWIHDHCGFWGHQYCARCRQLKYPEIPGRCSDCGELMKITEADYASR